MKKWVIGLVVVAALVGSFFAFSTPAKNDTTKTASTKVSITSFSQVQTAVKNGGQLLDVRTADEYTAGHIEGASNFSLQDLQAGKLPTDVKDQALFAYCRSGNRSGQATTILKAAGYTNVTDLGAITHVQAIGGKLVVN